MRIFYYLALCLIGVACNPLELQLETDPCQSLPNTYVPSFALELESVLQDMTTSGVPGIAVSIRSDHGIWSSSAGLAKIEDNIAMSTCHLQYLQSIAKTYMATAILKLREQGLLQLSDYIGKYLEPEVMELLPKANDITVEMLLNHQSGLPEYNFQPKYVAYFLQHPTHFFQPLDYLSFIKNQPLDFEPGTQHSYRNTNYLLLALIADKLTGNHAAYIQKEILDPLQLIETYYRDRPNYLDRDNLVNSYWDRYGDGLIENISLMQKINVSSLIGDDGIVATPHDAASFLHQLLEGQVISKESIGLMKQWRLDSTGQPTYGLGLDYAMINQKVAWGHSGGGIGAGCELYYFPEYQTTIFLAINLGTVTESPIHEELSDKREAIYDLILQ